MKKSILFFFLMYVLLSCSNSSKQAFEEAGQNTLGYGAITLPTDYPEEKDTLRLSELADTLFYVRLEHPGLTDDCQVNYLDSLILVYDNQAVMAFDVDGKLLYQLPEKLGCLDVLPEGASFYLYNFRDRIIKKYGFDGKERATIRLGSEIDTYGRNFVALSDTLFAISMMNIGYNPYELYFVNGEGKIIHRVKNREPYQPPIDVRVHHTIWHHRLFRNEDGCRYYPSYSDTLYEVRKDATIHPVMVENKISKIPLKYRLEYSGQDFNQFVQEMIDKGWNSVRHFETSRFHLVEYKIGGYSQMLSNYLVYDKNNKKLYRTNSQLTSALKEVSLLHFGIFNDYDGGLAFAPSSQSGDYLVMVNASGQQGKYNTRPKTLYEEGRMNGGKSYQVRSGVCKSSSHRQRLMDFFRDFDEKKHSMLMIVKPKIHIKRNKKMNMKQAGWAVMAIALAACSGNEKSVSGNKKILVDELPVVAHSVEVDGQEVTVCELGLLKDTLDLPLSYWVEDFEVVKLDTRDEALVGQGSVFVSDNYILVGRSGNVPCKLFRRDGSYVGNVGSIGQGPGEYTMEYDMQIDEQAERIYLLPRRAKSILVYNLRGEYLSDIPLNKKYEKLIVPKGKFKVDAAKNRVAVILLPFNYLPVVAWVQDMEGNFLHEVPMNYLKVTPDFSNEVISAKTSSDALDAHLATFFELRKDTLYYLNMESGKLLPKFTLDYGQRDITIHSYIDFPGHYIGSLEVPVQISENTYETRGRSFYMVDKKSGKGTFFRLNNDYLDNESEKYMPFQFSNGYYTLNIEPAVLKERLEKGLNNLNADRQEQMKSLLGTIDENDNNYILIGKLKRGL